MKKIIAIICIIILSGLVYYFFKIKARPQEDLIKINQSKSMKITSPAFQNGGLLPAKFTCDGEGVNPPLIIEGAPPEAQSLVLIADDPDAPAGTWIHWTVWNINSATGEIGENSVPEGAAEGTTSFGKTGYGAPCPPSGTHRYFFKIFALDTKLELSSRATAKDLTKAMEGHILDQAEIMGRYSRK